jgi:hypothetical protein
VNGPDKGYSSISDPEGCKYNYLCSFLIDERSKYGWDEERRRGFHRLARIFGSNIY